MSASFRENCSHFLVLLINAELSIGFPQTRSCQIGPREREHDFTFGAKTNGQSRRISRLRTVVNDQVQTVFSRKPGEFRKGQVHQWRVVSNFYDSKSRVLNASNGSP